MQGSVLDHVNLREEFRYISERGLSRLTDLCEIMASFGSDKGKGLHNYSVVYDWLFSRFRKDCLTVFELGLGTDKDQGASDHGSRWQAWRVVARMANYFSGSQIYGADINSDILFEVEPYPDILDRSERPKGDPGPLGSGW